MPDLNFEITGVEPAARGIMPLLHFHLHITSRPAAERIHSIMLQAQIQFQAPQRAYSAKEKEALVELFGTPDRWGQTLRNKLWTHAHTIVPSFTGGIKTILPVPCTYDLNVLSAKYFHALESGEAPLLFLFSGSIFYAEPPDDKLQVQQISWEKECVYRMPVEIWKSMMNVHYPNSGWVALQSDVLEQLFAYKRAHGLLTWDQTVQRLLGIGEQNTVGELPGVHR